MTVKELRKALEGVADDVEVTIFLPEYCNPQSKEDYMAYVDDAEFVPRSSISNNEFQITSGRRFAY